MYGIIIISEAGACMAQWPVRACFEIYCASRGGPCDSVALVLWSRCYLQYYDECTLGCLDIFLL